MAQLLYKIVKKYSDITALNRLLYCQNISLLQRITMFIITKDIAPMHITTSLRFYISLYMAYTIWQTKRQDKQRKYHKLECENDKNRFINNTHVKEKW